MPALVRELWRGDPASLRWISQDYNIVFRFEADGRGYYLRICHTCLHSLPEARQVMHFLRFLAAEDVPVGAPIPSVNGRYIEQLEGGYFAAAQKEAPGQIMEALTLNPSVYGAWGQSLGKLHAASRRYQPDPAIDYEFPTVQQFWRNIAPTVAGASAEIRRVYAELIRVYRRLADSGLRPHPRRLSPGQCHLGRARPRVPSTSTSPITTGISPMSVARCWNCGISRRTSGANSAGPSCAAICASIRLTSGG